MPAGQNNLFVSREKDFLRVVDAIEQKELKQETKNKRKCRVHFPQKLLLAGFAKPAFCLFPSPLTCNLGRGVHESFQIVRFFELFWDCRFRTFPSPPDRYPAAAQVHTPMHAASWGKWDVDAAAAVALVATVFVVVCVA